MTNDEFEPEDFEVSESKNVLDNPLKEGEPSVGVILASDRLDVRYYEGMNIKDALNQVKGDPAGDKFRLLLDGKISSMDTVIPHKDAEVIFVGEWTLGGKKKTC